MSVKEWIRLALFALLTALALQLGCTNGAPADDSNDNNPPGNGDTGGNDNDDDTAAAIVGVGDAVITDDGVYRYITASGVPEHETGQFPGPGNPNSISAQYYSVRMALHPVANATATSYTLNMNFGMALNGIPFDPFANEFYNNDRNSGWQEEPMPDGLGLDHNHAHVQPNGAYHYHGLPTGLIADVLESGDMTLVGFAADGFPIYALYGYRDANDSSSAVIELHSSYRLKHGTRPSGPGGAYDGTYVQDYEYVAGLGDLDAANGRTSVTPEFPDGTYYYVITADYPYIPRMFRATPDVSFRKGP
jgi:hypothetical protein